MGVLTTPFGGFSVSDFIFSPTWWFTMLLFGGVAVLSVLEWRGIVRTPFERVWPATAMGTGIACAVMFSAGIFMAVVGATGLRITGLPFYVPAILSLSFTAVIVAGLVLAFLRKPPRWAIAPHLREDHARSGAPE